MESESIPECLVRYMDGLKRRDVDQIASTVAEEGVFILPGNVLGKERFARMLRALYTAFPDWTYDQDSPRKIDDERWSVRWRQGGTHTGEFAVLNRPPIAPTGRVARIPDQDFFYRICDGKIVEIRPDPVPGGAPEGIFAQIGAEIP